jgi:hypothetical protein
MHFDTVVSVRQSQIHDLYDGFDTDEKAKNIDERNDQLLQFVKEWEAEALETPNWGRYWESGDGEMLEAVESDTYPNEKTRADDDDDDDDDDINLRPGAW